MRHTALPTRDEYSYRAACPRPFAACRRACAVLRTGIPEDSGAAAHAVVVVAAAAAAAFVVLQSRRSVLFALCVAGGRRRDVTQD